jgi:DNA (cytosine-5)-methyltransferase 1
MNCLSLFSGIGGLDLAAEWAGFTTVAFCEKDNYCQKVLAKRWPGVPIFDDIRTLTANSLGDQRIKLLTGGFPCQPFSHAGRRQGESDDRYLWPEMFRVIREVRPTWVCGENVSGFISMALDTVQADLEAEGYEGQTIVLPACAVGAPHRRDRVFIIAHAGSDGRGREPQRVPECAISTKSQNDSEQRHVAYSGHIMTDDPNSMSLTGSGYLPLRSGR